MNILEQAIKNKKQISEYSAKKILSAYNITVVKEILTNTLEHAIKSAEEIGYPIVLKGFSPTLSHKSEYGIIKLNLKNQNELKQAYQEITTNKKVKLEGVLVQKQIKGDMELLIGIKKDLTFGHFIIFGLGGIFAEVLNDIAIRILPVEKSDVQEMIKEIKGYKILEGYRGKEKVDIDKLIDILVKVNNLVTDFPQIKELDINPLIVQDKIPICVDALMILEG